MSTTAVDARRKKGVFLVITASGSKYVIGCTKSMGGSVVYMLHEPRHNKPERAVLYYCESCHNAGREAVIKVGESMCLAPQGEAPAGASRHTPPVAQIIPVEGRIYDGYRLTLTENLTQYGIVQCPQTDCLSIWPSNCQH